MNILVLLKQVPVSDAGGMDAARGVLRRDVGEKRMNPHDAAALEAGLLLKDAAGGTLTVLSMGPPSAKEMLQEALATGADHAALLCGSAFAGADVLATAQTLLAGCALMERTLPLGGYDAILGGAFTTDGGTGHTLGTLAALRNWSYYAGVTEVGIQDGRLILTQALTCTIQRVWTNRHAVLSVDTDAYALRVPTLARRLAARRIPVQVVAPEELELASRDCGLAGSPTRVAKVETLERVPAAPPITGDAADMARRILMRCVELGS